MLANTLEEQTTDSSEPKYKRTALYTGLSVAAPHQQSITSLAGAGKEDAELAIMVRRARTFTNAYGAAIGMFDLQTGQIVCCARSGSSSPAIGSVIGAEGTLIGLCVQKRVELRCDDATTDPRVEMQAVQGLGARSMVVVPIAREKQISGVLAVFAPGPNAFTFTHVAMLKTIGDQIVFFLRKRRDGQNIKD
ncbi:MAG TPA: GAF domain-containing protein [Candidatus Angelobacter sp.]|nr:GAF domain-containing protein [Candidatus Angelobacter sp.]